MEIISHRGYWLQEEEKNTTTAFERSFSLGFGTETDIRDYMGELVISHDPANAKSLKFSTFLEVYKDTNCNGTLALNIKADGLQNLILENLDKYKITEYFLFDMSVPDLRKSLAYDLKCFTRISDEELIPSFQDRSVGLWVDTFERNWLTADKMQNLFKSEKIKCFVSNELHGKDHLPLWQMLIDGEYDDFIICTDIPYDAKKFFKGNL